MPLNLSLVSALAIRPDHHDRLVGWDSQLSSTSGDKICNQNRPVVLAAIVDEPPTSLGLD